MWRSVRSNEPIDAMSDGFVLLDGGLSTALESLEVDTSGDLWTAWAAWRRPDDLIRAHRSFVDSGAEIVTTASYQCDTELLERAGADSRTAREVLASTTDLARRAIEGTTCRVAASIGPFGASLADGSEYTGDYPVPWKAVESFHRRRLEVLVDSGPDLFAVETIPRGDEGLLVAELLVEFGAPMAWFSFGCRSATTTYGGDDAKSAVEAVLDYPNLMAVGVNCVAPGLVGDVLGTLDDIAVPFVVYPNHGRRWDGVERMWSGDAEPVDDDLVASWLARGARFVGGCCGTGPDGIARLAETRSRLADRGEFT